MYLSLPVLCVAQSNYNGQVIRFNVSIPWDQLKDDNNMELRASINENVLTEDAGEDQVPLLSTKDELVFKVVLLADRWTKTGKRVLVLDRIYLNAIGEVPFTGKLEYPFPAVNGDGNLWTREIRLDLSLESELLSHLNK
jgi:hypothetical protein